MKYIKSSTLNNMEILQIGINHHYYPQEQELRNEILLRPIGVLDHAWEMHDAESFHFVAIEHNKLIACVVFRPLDNMSQKTGQLMQMAVDSHLQGKGTGRKLVDELLKFAAKNGFQEVVCHARNNVVGFYEKLGFEVYDQAFEEVGILHRHMKISL